MSGPARRRPRAKPALIAWKPAHRELFRLAGDDWSPPAQVRVIGSMPGVTTWRATFVNHQGDDVQCVTRLRHTANDVFVIGEELNIRFTIRGKAR